MTPTVLVILDGFGYNPNPTGNAILTARTPYLDWLWNNYPHTLIKAAAEEVGLNFGQIGNSEVGHMAIGSGRIIPSPLQRINSSISERSFYQNTALLGAMYHARTHTQRVHIIGMISSAGVHGDLQHMIAVLQLAKNNHLHDVYLHIILDGRDTGPKDALLHLTELLTVIKQLKVGQIATISGRAIAMDRNNNWAKTEQYYQALCGFSSSNSLLSAKGAIEQAYQEGYDDETIPPRCLLQDGALRPHDTVIFTNFRDDRMRQITKAITVPGFAEFRKNTDLSDAFTVTMTQYEQNLPVQVAFPPLVIQNTFSDVIDIYGLSQLHISESEKYAHITRFINCGREKTLSHEDFLNIPSDPPDAFIQHPEMKATQITDAIIKDIIQRKHDVILANYANCDMIGHTGNFTSSVLAVEHIDRCIGKLAQQMLAMNGHLFITADHGNAEQKLNITTGQATKDHTVNPVPFIYIANSVMTPARQTFRITLGSSPSGILQDVAPTILNIMRLPIPPEMTGTTLFSAAQSSE